ncbi:hypothetical protein [Massilia antarctica]|uniref:hypothetical protein n=1 Tax=Massilia antarctica TaxID=2765360 RepID=UPI0006BD67C7|nr:hypothetical protein [Massilia sp. H27-R4]MCY0913265.1 hypothetical protein [Massilia sp. H27-R4]CUI07889.1 hypothetical protein BN2497_10555 [Janthinobacterium sp. CG23_2]CUU31675.1 hypothetical protein BN3177_10555 [Janthinobacterium sp. CG23_2]
MGTLAAGVTGGIWKIVAVILLAALLVVGAWTGGGWFLAARDRDAAQVELVAERAKSAAYAAAVERQNAAVDALAAAKLEADARGQAAQQQAAAAGKRFDAALAKVAGARATTCAEAMPAVNVILESVR